MTEFIYTEYDPDLFNCINGLLEKCKEERREIISVVLDHRTYMDLVRDYSGNRRKFISKSFPHMVCGYSVIISEKDKRKVGVYVR